MNEHPMDEIPVRQMKFRFEDVAPEDFVWSKSSPEFSMFINALGIHVPHFERFLVAVMRSYRDELADPKLKKDVQAIIGQEAHHAFNFVRWTKAMAGKYPGIAELDQHASDYFANAREAKNKQFEIGFTAGYETFTFLAGMIILDRYDELLAEAEPNLRALWVWHQVEEVEHGAVAFDFYRAFYPEHEWYRRYMVLKAFVHIATETFLAYRRIIAVERPSFMGKLKAWRFFCGFAWDLFYTSLPVYRRSYHPRNHPICNDSQNEVALAWRHYEREGNDVHWLPDDLMARILP